MAVSATSARSLSTLSNRLFRLVTLVTARKRRGPPGERHVMRRSYSLLRASLGSVFAAALQALESIESTNWIGLGMAFRDWDGLSHGKPSFIEDEAMSEA